MYVKNAQGTIARALDSIALQDYYPKQLVVIDGASSDGTTDILKAHRQVVDVLLSEPDDGPVDAANKGLARADGDILLFVMADDWLEQGALARIAEAFRLHPTAAVVSSGARIVQAASGGGYRTVLERRGTDNALNLATMLDIPLTAARYWRRELIDILGPLDRKWPAAHDRDWFVRACLLGVESAVIEDVLYTYLQHPGSTTLGDDPGRVARFLREHVEMAASWLALTSDPATRRTLLQWRRQQLCEGILLQLRQKSPGSSMAWSWLALRHDPAALGTAWSRGLVIACRKFRASMTTQSRKKDRS